MRIFAMGIAMACTLGAAYVLAQDQESLRGDVVAVAGSQLRIRSDVGQETTVALPDTLRISVRAPVALNRIRQGDFVGTTAASQPDGTLRASEVHIFPESMRGTGEGHRPMASAPGSTMTNATVSSVSGRRTTTNATVASRDAGDAALSLKLAYPGGEQTVVVPPGVPVMAIEIGDRGSLVPGAHVTVSASRDASGRLSASRITVTKDGSAHQSR